MKEKDTLECPFCEEETIKVIKKTEFSASRRNHGRDFKMNMISTECSNCGKQESDIKKKLKKKGYPIR